MDEQTLTDPLDVLRKAIRMPDAPDPIWAAKAVLGSLDDWIADERQYADRPTPALREAERKRDELARALKAAQSAEAMADAMRDEDSNADALNAPRSIP